MATPLVISIPHPLIEDKARSSLALADSIHFICCDDAFWDVCGYDDPMEGWHLYKSVLLTLLNLIFNTLYSDVEVPCLLSQPGCSYMLPLEIIAGDFVFGDVDGGHGMGMDISIFIRGLAIPMMMMMIMIMSLIRLMMGNTLKNNWRRGQRRRKSISCA